MDSDRLQDPRTRVVELFHRVAASVPAYRAFLREHGVDPGEVRTFADFERLPLLTKENYHRRYSLPDLCRQGRLDGCDMIAVSSGSTGQPTIWPRSVTDEVAVAARFEQVFADSFAAGERTTLAVVCFPLGTWVGGLYTLACTRHLAAKGYPITVVAPGNNKAEILRVIPELAPHCDQTVLLGYPPFVKDVIDTGIAAGLDWTRYAVKLVLAGEVFSEEWRDLVGRRAGMRSPCYDSASLYGTADAGVLGTETPLSVCIRRFLAARPEAAGELFGEARLPTLVQYDPGSRFFEVRDGTLLFSADNGIPLLRYHIADEGGLIGYRDMLAFCGRHGFDPVAELGPGARGVRPQPFAWVFGRSYFTVSYFGANVYPENVTVGLEQPAVSGWVTGKFVLEVVGDADGNPHLSVTVELAPGEAGDAAREHMLAESIRDQLQRLNSEFAHYVPTGYQLPKVTLRPAGDPEYFPVGVKHRYTRGKNDRSLSRTGLAVRPRDGGPPGWGRRPAKIAAMAEPASTLAAGPAGKAGTVGTVETQYLDLPNPVRLDCGRELYPIRVAYETYGTLAPRRDNVILVCHALSGDAHAAGFAKKPPESSTRDGFAAEDRDGTAGKGLGWWDGMIGPGKAFDTDRFFVVSTNLLGGCRGTTGPSSTDPATGRPYGPDFPVITVADMVRTERAFLDVLGIERLAAVAGGSLGGMQAFEWAILYPDQVGAVVAIASTHALHPQGVAWNAIARNAIIGDPAWQGGQYYGTGRAPDAGMGVARMVGHVTYLSALALSDKFGRRLQFADDIRYTITEPEFAVESYLRHQADSFVRRFDANTYLYMSRALTYFDLARQHGSGSLAQALGSVSARTLLIAFSSDWLYPPSASSEVEQALRALGKPAEFHVIEAPYGHDCFLLEEARQTPIIRRFLGMPA